MARDADSDRFDAIVVGAGPAGEVVAGRLSERGMKVALVEAELIGGECAYWACIPSKTLLRPGEVRFEAQRAPGTSSPEQRWQEIADYRDYMIRHLDDSGEVDSYAKLGVEVFKGAGTLTGRRTLAVGDRELESERIILATGSETGIPPIPGLEQAGYWTNREATTFERPPASAAIIGGGPVGIELAQLLRRFDTKVHLIESADRLLSREDERVSEMILEALRADGVDVHVSAEVESVGAHDGVRSVSLAGGATLDASELIVAAGRKPRIAQLGLEHAGIDPGERGIEVDERCRVGDGIWAVGDVTGTSPFTHVAKYQARVACADIAGESPRADYHAIPRVVFSDPELAAVGMTAAGAAEAGIDAVSATLELAGAIARPWTYETDPRGELCVIADRERRILIGAWAVGPLAGEWIHYAALAIKARLPLALLHDTVAQFPTYTEAYLKALERLDL
jgi:pyruvate/2-oxoglutarate dehydrogenase complex dihydrolipoamide dehydrogenase (E3) component